MGSFDRTFIIMIALIAVGSLVYTWIAPNPNRNLVATVFPHLEKQMQAQALCLKLYGTNSEASVLASEWFECTTTRGLKLHRNGAK